MNAVLLLLLAPFILKDDSMWDGTRENFIPDCMGTASETMCCLQHDPSLGFALFSPEEWITSISGPNQVAEAGVVDELSLESFS